jgi:hypothetical protein
MLKISFLITFLTLFIFFGLPQMASSAEHSAFCRDQIALALPVVPQSTTYTCGVACLHSVLRYWGRFSPGEISLAYYLGTIFKGRTDPENIVLAANQFRLFAQHRFGATTVDLRLYLAKGETVFVGWLSDGVGHYSVVRGMAHDHITLMDPFFARENPGQYNTLANDKFVPKWNDGKSMFGEVIRISASPLR